MARKTWDGFEEVELTLIPFGDPPNPDDLTQPAPLRHAGLLPRFVQDLIGPMAWEREEEGIFFAAHRVNFDKLDLFPSSDHTLWVHLPGAPYWLWYGDGEMGFNVCEASPDDPGIWLCGVSESGQVVAIQLEYTPDLPGKLRVSFN